MKKQEFVKVLVYAIVVATIKIATIFILPKVVENIFNHFKKGSHKKLLYLPDKEVKE